MRIPRVLSTAEKLALWDRVAKDVRDAIAGGGEVDMLLRNGIREGEPQEGWRTYHPDGTRTLTVAYRYRKAEMTAAE